MTEATEHALMQKTSIGKLHELIHLVLIKILSEIFITVSILQARKMRHREVNLHRTILASSKS